jgi:hypothetical protein
MLEEKSLVTFQNQSIEQVLEYQKITGQRINLPYPRLIKLRKTGKFVISLPKEEGKKIEYEEYKNPFEGTILKTRIIIKGYNEAQQKALYTQEYDENTDFVLSFGGKEIAKGTYQQLKKNKEVIKLAGGKTNKEGEIVANLTYYNALYICLRDTKEVVRLLVGGKSFSSYINFMKDFPPMLGVTMANVEFSSHPETTGGVDYSVIDFKVKSKYDEVGAQEMFTKAIEWNNTLKIYSEVKAQRLQQQKEVEAARECDNGYDNGYDGVEDLNAVFGDSVVASESAQAPTHDEGKAVEAGVVDLIINPNVQEYKERIEKAAKSKAKKGALITLHSAIMMDHSLNENEKNVLVDLISSKE